MTWKTVTEAFNKRCHFENKRIRAISGLKALKCIAFFDNTATQAEAQEKLTSQLELLVGSSLGKEQRKNTI